MHPLPLSSAKLESVWKCCCPGFPSQSFTFSQLPLAETFCKHNAFDPPNLKVVGVLHKIVKQQGWLWGQRATVFPHFLCTGRQLPCPVTGNGTRCPSGQLGTQRRRRGWPARQVPGRDRHGSRSNWVTEEHLMSCEQVDGKQKGWYSALGLATVGSPHHPLDCRDWGEVPDPWVERTHP